MYRKMMDENRNTIGDRTSREEVLQQIRKLSLGEYAKPKPLDLTEYDEFSSPLTGLSPWPNYKDLEHLPVPSLEQTMTKLKSLSRILCSEEEHRELVEKLETFFGGEDSVQLQKILEMRADIQDNWLRYCNAACKYNSRWLL